MHKKARFISIFLLVPLIGGLVDGAAWDFDFDFSGYQKKTDILVTSCSGNIQEQINKALAGKTTTSAIEFPTVNPNLPHVTCSNDDVMGKVVNFTIYKTDNDVTGKTDRQRLEMKVFEPSPEDLKAIKGDQFIYSWWFRLNPTLATSNSFFHIFQLKAVGDIDGNPMVTFTLTTKDGLNLRLRNDDETSQPNLKMTDLPVVLGKWVQAYVQVRYLSGKTEGASGSGFVKVVLKDQNGLQLYPKSGATGLFYTNMFWEGTDFVRPKWGLYRSLSDTFHYSDWELFQNVQIWKK